MALIALPGSAWGAKHLHAPLAPLWLQVSRRLQRRLHKELGAGNFGYVKLAVQTYCYLLEHNKAEKSNLLANELVVRTVVTRRT